MTTLRRFIGLTGTLVLMVTLAPLLGSTTVASAGSPLGGISRSSSTTPNLSPQRNAPTLIGTRQASQTVIISRTDSGYYYDFGDHNPTHNNYGVGYEDSIGYRYRNFFVFSLAGIHGTITSATFQAVNNGGEAPRTPTPCTTS